MNTFHHKEADCQQVLDKIGKCYHLWTPENFEILFRNDAEFRIGMGIIAIVSMCFRDIAVISFEIMTNHLHFLVAGEQSRINEYFEMIVKLLRKMAMASGRTINWGLFKPGIRLLDSLADVRNVLIYINRNGYLANGSYSPFSYPWGANYCYFNDEARERYKESSVFSTIKDRRLISHSHVSDDIKELKIVGNCFSPFSFCEIETGETIFRNAAQYFFLLGRNIEQNNKIAKDIGESISYTDDELYAAISRKSKEEYSTGNLSQLPSEAKIRIANIMRYDYNASPKQIQRFLRMDANVLSSIFGCSE